LGPRGACMKISALDHPRPRDQPSSQVTTQLADRGASVLRVLSYGSDGGRGPVLTDLRARAEGAQVGD
jgi:hypothetical protein